MFWMGECWQQKHTQHAPSSKTKCDDLYGWIKKRSHTQKLTKNSELQRYGWECRRKRRRVITAISTITTLLLLHRCTLEGDAYHLHKSGCPPWLLQAAIDLVRQWYWFYRLVGLVVRRPPRERKIPDSNPACAGIFWGSSHTSDLKIGTPVATLPGAWRYRVSTGTGRPGVSIL